MHLSVHLKGLANLIHFDQPSFSVVSDGAECILLNKELYRRHASVELINKVKYNVSSTYIIII